MAGKDKTAQRLRRKVKLLQAELDRKEFKINTLDRQLDKLTKDVNSGKDEAGNDEQLT